MGMNEELKASLEEKLSSLRRTQEQRYIQTHKTSQELFERARKVLPGGVSYSLRYFRPFPFYVKEAKGSRIWDVDENEYVDFWMVHGAAVLGHNHEVVINALLDTLRNQGGHFGWTNKWEILWGEAVTKWFGMDMVRPTNSGTEANMYATRLARAYTGRDKIGKFIGGWHGSYDGLHKGVREEGKKESLGLIRSLQDEVVLLKYNDKDYTISRVLKGDLAAVIVEPVMGSAGAIPGDRDFLHSLQEACRKTGTLFILDEVITGFRFFGGGKTHYDLDPDILVTGKAVGGQYFPGAGAVLGKKEVMSLFDQIAHPNPEERAFHGGTYTGNLITTSAGYALINYLMANKWIYQKLEEMGAYMREKLEEALSPLGGRALITGLGSMIGVHILTEEGVDPSKPEGIMKFRDKALMEALHLWSLNHGFAYLSPDSPHLFLSTSHSLEDVDEFAEVIKAFVKEIL